MARGPGKKFAAFLTHDWGTDQEGRDNHARVARVAETLKLEGFSVWFDQEQMRGDVNRKMTKGIDDSSCIIVFVTKNYIMKAGGDGPRGSRGGSRAAGGRRRRQVEHARRRLIIGREARRQS